jgi:hypothetical protein
VATVQLLRRLLTGEDAQPDIFIDTLMFLQVINDQAADALGVQLETYTLRVLARLGYVASHQSYAHRLVAGTDWLTDTTALPREATTAIRNGFAASHL